VVEPNPSEKYFSSSVGMIFPFPTEWKVIKFMFQTTNQYIYIFHMEHHGLSFNLGCASSHSARKCGWRMTHAVKVGLHSAVLCKFLNLAIEIPSGKQTINGDFSWFNNGLTMVQNGMIMGYTLWLSQTSY
jgi:hypothetical protein